MNLDGIGKAENAKFSVIGQVVEDETAGGAPHVLPVVSLVHGRAFVQCQNEAGRCGLLVVENSFQTIKHLSVPANSKMIHLN